MREQIPGYDNWKLSNGPYENDGEPDPRDSNYAQARSTERHLLDEPDAAHEEEPSDEMRPEL